MDQYGRLTKVPMGAPLDELMVDVEAVAVAAEEAQRGVRHKALGEGGGAQGKRDGGGAGDGDEGEAVEVDGRVDVVVEVTVSDEDSGDGEQGKGEGQPGKAQDLRAQGAADSEGEPGTAEERVLAAVGGGVEIEDRGVMGHEDGAREGGHGGQDEREDHQAVAAAHEEDEDGPDEIKLLFHGERPEVAGKVVGDGAEGVVHVERRVLQIDGDQAQQVEVERRGVMREEEADERGQDDAIVKRKDAEDAASVEVAEVMRVGERIEEDAVMRKPESAKKRSTPAQPAALMPSSTSSRRLPVWVLDQKRWKKRTARMATPRMPSRAWMWGRGSLT